MNTSTVIPVVAFTAMSLARACAAGDLLDAPGPGYFQQIEALSPNRQRIADPEIKVGPAVTIILSAPNHNFPERLTEIEHPFSRAIKLFQQSPALIKSGEGVLQANPVLKKSP